MYSSSSLAYRQHSIGILVAVSIGQMYLMSKNFALLLLPAPVRKLRAIACSHGSEHQEDMTQGRREQD